MKLIVAGSREFTDYSTLETELSNIKDSITEIVSGTARGADRLGERYANENNITLQRMPAEWDKHGRSAGYKRNEQMAEYADSLIAFWDGQSRGTKHMIDIARRLDLEVIVIKTK